MTVALLAASWAGLAAMALAGAGRRNWLLRPWPDLTARLGRAVRQSRYMTWADTLGTPDDTFLGRGTLVAGATVVLSPPIVPLAMLGVVMIAVGRARRRSAGDRPDPRDLGHALDLLLVSTVAGLDVAGALHSTAPYLEPSLREAATRGLGALDRGASVEMCLLTSFEPAGSHGRRAATAISDAIRDGASVTGAITRTADDLVLETRRQAERRARRLPVQLLFPLVTCILPAFALLTVVPLLAGSLGSLPL